MTSPAEPRLATRRNPDRPTLGHRVAFAAKMLGTPLMPHQRRIADVALELDDPRTGRPAHTTVVVTVPRQSGKTALLWALIIARALSERDMRMWYTAQTGQHARKRFRELVDAVNRSPLPPGMISGIRHSAGDESISIGTSRLSLFAPQPDALHGEATDLVCIDEAWSFSEDRGRQLMQAGAPTGATRPRRQTWIVSTAGDDTSEFLNALQDRARESVDDPTSQIAYFEWSAEGVDQSLPDGQLVDAVIAAHPAAGRTIDRRFIASQLEELGRDEWLRAFGNVRTRATARVIPAEKWAAARRPIDPPAGGPAVLAVDVTPMRDRTAIAAAWTVDGHSHTAVVGHGDGTEWAAAELARISRRLRAPVVIDDGSPASTLIDQLKRAGIQVRTLSGRDIARACGEFYDEVMTGRLTLTPDQALDAAAAGAVQRTLADAWAWGRRRSSSDISPLCAVTWAAWGLRHAEPGPVIV